MAIEVDLGEIAEFVTSNPDTVMKAATAGSYLLGLAFSVGAIMKFKQHKDNPTQIPIGTPVAMLGLGTAFLAAPSLLGGCCDD